MYLVRGSGRNGKNARERFELALGIFQRIGAEKDVEKVLNKKELPVK